MHDGWYGFEIWRERQRDLLEEAQAQRLARAARPGWRKRLGEYRRLWNGFAARISNLRVVSVRRAFPPDEEIAAPSEAGSGLVEAIFEEGARPVRSSSVIEFHQEERGYVIREVDLATGDHILYLSTEEPEWAAWIWDRKTHWERPPAI